MGFFNATKQYWKKPKNRPPGKMGWSYCACLAMTEEQKYHSHCRQGLMALPIFCEVFCSVFRNTVRSAAFSALLPTFSKNCASAVKAHKSIASTEKSFDVFIAIILLFRTRIRGFLSVPPLPGHPLLLLGMTLN